MSISIMQGLKTALVGLLLLPFGQASFNQNVTTVANSAIGQLNQDLITSQTGILGTKPLHQLWKKAESPSVIRPTFHYKEVCEGKPQLEWNPAYTGPTGYIDAINSQNMTRPIMCGKDSLGRVFIAAKTVCTSVLNGVARVTTRGVTTVFQRYANVHLFVVSGHRQINNCEIGVVDSERIIHFENMFQHGASVPITYWLPPHPIIAELRVDRENDLLHRAN